MSMNGSVKLVSWNINSVRRRPALIQQFIDMWRPDIICLQEIKCANDHFPGKMFTDAGFAYHAVNGQKAYHGVAIVSKIPFESEDRRYFCGKTDARHVTVRFGDDAPQPVRGVDIHNFYVPAGGDIPDRDINDKFDHKLTFLTEMREFSSGLSDGSGRGHILLGDLNIAPLESDVWSHRQLLDVVSHTPVEVDHLTQVQQAGPWVDVVRQHIPPSERLFSWWSYRARDWRRSDRGRRLDHIWTSPELSPHVRSAAVAKDVRGWPEPSDHAPVMIELAAGA